MKNPLMISPLQTMAFTDLLKVLPESRPIQCRQRRKAECRRMPEEKPKSHLKSKRPKCNAEVQSPGKVICSNTPIPGLTTIALLGACVALFRSLIFSRRIVLKKHEKGRTRMLQSPDIDCSIFPHRDLYWRMANEWQQVVLRVRGTYYCMAEMYYCNHQINQADRVQGKPRKSANIPHQKAASNFVHFWLIRPLWLFSPQNIAHESKIVNHKLVFLSLSLPFLAFLWMNHIEVRNRPSSASGHAIVPVRH